MGDLLDVGEVHRGKQTQDSEEQGGQPQDGETSSAVSTLTCFWDEFTHFVLPPWCLDSRFTSSRTGTPAQLGSRWRGHRACSLGLQMGLHDRREGTPLTPAKPDGYDGYDNLCVLTLETRPSSTCPFVTLALRSSKRDDEFHAEVLFSK